jgi:protein-L-isoaspartate(D-aspartate) O-methyltransferase
MMSESEWGFAERRNRMVVQQIEARGVRDAAVLAAMRLVPRHCFVETLYQSYAYDDTPLPIPARQTISQPYVVALMISALELKQTDRVLEVGTGSGYAAALLSRIVSRVYTIERHECLVEYARLRLEQLEYDNVHLCQGDGTLGWPECAPFDGIIVAAGGPRIPTTLQNQLASGGRLIMPVGNKRRSQQLIRLTRLNEHQFSRQELGPVAFVPLVGDEGWQA